MPIDEQRRQQLLNIASDIELSIKRDNSKFRMPINARDKVSVLPPGLPRRAKCTL